MDLFLLAHVGALLIASDIGSSRRRSCNACRVLGYVIEICTALVVIMGGTSIHRDIAAGMVG
jgi:hypothetical protein